LSIKGLVIDRGCQLGKCLGFYFLSECFELQKE